MLKFRSSSALTPNLLSFTLFLFPSPYEPSDMPAPFDDIDPDYGLHGYSMHLELHNTVESIASVSFSQLFCRKGAILDFVQIIG